MWYNKSMAFICKKKNREGKHYVFLVESYREGDKVKQRVLKNYGLLEVLEEKEPGAYERLRSEAKQGKLTEMSIKELTIKLDLTEKIQLYEKNYGWKLLDEIYKHLEIDQVIRQKMRTTEVQFDVNDILRLLVFQRILNPGSKLATVHSQLELFGDWNIDENSMYRSLMHLFEMKEAIQLKAHESITEKIGRMATLVFYDVTNYYFEIDMNDEDIIDEETGEILSQGIRKKGASKENRKSPIVQMGLFMDTNGIPICYKLFKGNTPDVSTYTDAIAQVKKQFGIEKVVVVADKAMNSGNNIIQTSNNKDGWLFSQKHRGKKGVCKELQAFILDPADWQFNEDVTFGQKSMIREKIVKTTTKPIQTKTVTEKVLVTWSQKYANREQIRRDSAVDYAKKLTNPELFRETCKKGGKRYLELYTLDKETNEKKPFAPFIEINQEAIDFDAQFDGINVLVTSEVTMSDEEILASYKELAKIEDSFKVTKTEFDSRPVYLYKPEHIEAHFLSCFLALVLMRILQHKINNKMSPKRIIRALQSATTSMLEQGFYRVQGNEDLIVLNTFLDISWEKSYLRYEQLNRYGVGWFTTT